MTHNAIGYLTEADISRLAVAIMRAMFAASESASLQEAVERAIRIEMETGRRLAAGVTQS